MAFTKTVGGLDPYSMPSDGGWAYCNGRVKQWERREYHKASRREAKQEIKEQSSE